MFTGHLKGGAIIKSCINVTGGCTAGPDPFKLGIYCNAPISKFRHWEERKSSKGFNWYGNWVQLPLATELETGGGEGYPKGIIKKKKRRDLSVWFPKEEINLTYPRSWQR